MNADKILNLLGSVVVVALVATILRSGNTSGILRAFGDSFSSVLRAAQGI